MKLFETRRTIAASPETLWAILTDPERIVAGGFGITRLDGVIAQGHRIRLESEAAPGRVFSLGVEEATPHRRMVWSSGAPLVFNGRRSFTLTPLPGGTEFHMAEVFKGLMLPLIWRRMPDLQPGFEAFADGLKREAESGR